MTIDNTWKLQYFLSKNVTKTWGVSHNRIFFISFFADWKMPLAKTLDKHCVKYSFHSNQASYLFFFQILFSGRDKSCLNLTLLLNTHRYQLLLKVPCPLRFVFLSMAGTMLALHWPIIHHICHFFSTDNFSPHRKCVNRDKIGFARKRSKSQLNRFCNKTAQISSMPRQNSVNYIIFYL